MMRWAPLLLLVCIVRPAFAQVPLIAIILDDLGNDRPRGLEAARLPGPVTLAVLPGTSHGPRIAEDARAAGKELMLHLPMESADARRLGPGGLTQHMTASELDGVMRDNLADLPGIAGINNHMGSLLTRHPQAMHQLMAWIRARGGLYFIDSRTDTATVAEGVARELGVPTARRDVFLDNERDEAYIAGQFDKLLRLARERGSAIAIGHPYRETLNVLYRELARLDRLGVELAPVSRVIERQAQQPRFPPWHVSSSRSLQGSKNSKPSR